MLNFCPQCETWYNPTRHDQIYCGDRCRSAGFRAGRQAPARRVRPAIVGDVAGDCLFPSNNDLEIPALDLALQGDALDLPVTQWGSISRHADMPGTWHFYTDDFHFATLWDHPERVTATPCVSCVEINYSTTEQNERARIIWQVYRKRWIARYWQARGIRVWVDLNVSAKADPINRLGIPPGWRAFATRGYADAPGNLERQHDIASQIAGEAAPLFVVYSGGKMIRELCQARGWLYLPDQIGGKL